ncbi:MAG: DUF4249 domain-containing protein [Bacteroidales bacterium]|nr:DUF4249 domain-containing protein [Bacteroidales bacterium]
MNRIFIIAITLISLSIIKSCITPFEPEGISSIDNMVVIEGNILQNDTTRVVVSRSLSLNQENRVEYIESATVWVESDSGVKYNAVEKRESDKVYYLINTVGIDPSLEYKLVVSIGSKKYESNFVSIRRTPEIDSIGYSINTDSTGLTFYVNTHDSENKTWYYMWSFTEDWEFRSNFLSLHDYNPESMSIYEITMDENRYYCWSKDVSRSILIATTNHLNEDRVFRKPLLYVPSGNSRINYLYSMELTQIAVGRDAYGYWENVKKNSDEIGGIFAPQPSEMAGNIRCVTIPSEKVIGYISGAVVSKKRVFFRSIDIGIYKDEKDCEMHNVGPDNPLPIDSLYKSGYDVISFFEESNESSWVIKRCVDCKVYGTKNKPSFWPNNHI